MDEKDVHLMGQHCTVNQLKVNKVLAAEQLLHSSSGIQGFYLLLYEGW
jgi:hypothetical protein